MERGSSLRAFFVSYFVFLVYFVKSMLFIFIATSAFNYTFKIKRKRTTLSRIFL